MTTSTVKNINVAGNVTAENFDMTKLDNHIKGLKQAYRQVLAFADEHKKAIERNAQIQGEMQSALDNADWTELSKLTAERKRVEAKIAETDAAKIQKFDECINGLVDFTTQKHGMDKTQQTVLVAVETPTLKKAA